MHERLIYIIYVQNVLVGMIPGVVGMRLLNGQGWSSVTHLLRILDCSGAAGIILASTFFLCPCPWDKQHPSLSLWQQNRPGHC
jgi:hypothetical protein